MIVNRIVWVLILFLAVVSCGKEDKIESEIAEIEIDLLIERFDRAFNQAEPEDLPKLKSAFPFLFSKRIPDSVWLYRMKDTLQEHLFEEVQSHIGNFETVETELLRLFQHLKYYDKSFSVPRVITLTNDVDYRNKVIVTDTIVLIALDNFLGSEHEFYGDIPRYKTQNMVPEQIVPSVATSYAERSIYQAQKKTLLDDMVFFGKQLYFLDKMIPFKTDEEKIGYTPTQLQFAKLNEAQIWTHLIENEYLFSTDSSLPARFVADAPFTKFYLELDRESPGRLGRYIGWQIVRAYMQNNDVSLMDMLKTDPTEIFNKSNYKPPK